MASARARWWGSIHQAGSPEGGLAGCFALEAPAGDTRVHRKELLGAGGARGDDVPTDAHAVFLRAQLHVVADAHRRHHHADLGGELPPDGRDAVEQIAARGLVDQPDEAEADLEFEEVDLQQGFDGSFRGRGGGARRLRGWRGAWWRDSWRRRALRAPAPWKEAESSAGA
jgi:hypothetical protein